MCSCRAEVPGVASDALGLTLSLYHSAACRLSFIHNHDHDQAAADVYRGFRPLCHLNWAKVRTKATASEFASYNLCEDADISAQKYTLAYRMS